MVVHGQADLLEVVGALEARGRLAHLLDGGEQEADQHGDDGDDDQQLDQREGASATAAGVCVDAAHETDPQRAKRPPYSSCPSASGAGAFGIGGACQIFTVPSRLAEAIHFPSGLKATAWTQLAWPRRVWASRPGPSQTVTVPSVLPQARRGPPRSKATHWTP